MAILLLGHRLVRLDELGQLLAGNIFHRDVVSPVDLTDIVNIA